MLSTNHGYGRLDGEDKVDRAEDREDGDGEDADMSGTTSKSTTTTILFSGKFSLILTNSIISAMASSTAG